MFGAQCGNCPPREIRIGSPRVVLIRRWYSANRAGQHLVSTTWLLFGGHCYIRQVSYAKICSRNQLLKLTLPLVQTHGFTREALSLSVLSLPTPHTEPLRDAAVSALFGTGDDARRTLVTAWLDEGRTQMRTTPTLTIKDALSTRLKYNYPVLGLLPEVRYGRFRSRRCNLCDV